MPRDVSPARSRGLAPTRNSSWHQDPVAQGPGSMAAALQGVFSRGHAPILCHHEGMRGPVLGWCGRAQPCSWGCRDAQEGGLAGCTCSAGLSSSSSLAWRGLFPISAQAALTHVVGESPLLILGHRRKAQHLGGPGWMAALAECPALCPSSPCSCPPCSRGCHQPLEGSHAEWGLVLQAGPGALGSAGHPGGCEQSPRVAPGLC